MENTIGKSTMNNTLLEHKYNPNLLYIGQYGTSGYASAAKCYIADFIMKGINVCWKPLYFDDTVLGNDNYINIIAKSAIGKKVDCEFMFIHSTPDLWPDYVDDFDKFIGVQGFTTWETTKLPKRWVECMNMVPTILCPSKFNQTTFKNSGVTSNIVVHPHIFFHRGVVGKKENVKIQGFDGKIADTKKFTFYCIAELNERKGIVDLLECFEKGFKNNSNVQLILKLHYKNYHEDNVKYCIDKILSHYSGKIPDNVIVLIKNMSDTDILWLHNFSDCYVSLNRGEGFGLTIHDAFNYGKKVITTGFGGQIEYLTENCLVDYKLEPVSGMEEFSSNYGTDQLWAIPNKEHVIEKMLEATK